MKFKNIIGHLKIVHTHRKWVRYYCSLFGIERQGWLHDLSKYSPTEFLESINYYTGVNSPIDNCKKDKGYSEAWMHHKGRNKHHYEYWIDNFDNGGQALIMPFNYALELVCDYLGAGRAYMKDNFSFKAEYEWWLKKIEKPIAMHPVTKDFVERMLNFLYRVEERNINLNGYDLSLTAREIYNNSLKKLGTLDEYKKFTLHKSI